jgi:predicted MFS family arabinose efflux permease
MGEIMGAEIYVTETIKPPAQYPAVSFIILASSLGSTAALAISALIMKSGLNWRVAFWVGAGIAVIGSIARTRLRETPEFLEAKEKKRQALKERHSTAKTDFPPPPSSNKLSKAHLAYILVQCGWPMAFYFGYLYFNPILKDSFGYSSSDIIFHNFLLSLIVIVSDVAFAMLSYYVPPLKILWLKGKFFIFFTVAFPFLVTLSSQAWHLFLLQAIILSIPLSPTPADAIFIRQFPVLRRFTTVGFIYALSRALMYVINSFGLVYLTEGFGYWGAWVIMAPVTLGFLWGVKHFRKLEQHHKENLHIPEGPVLKAS